MIILEDIKANKIDWEEKRVTAAAVASTLPLT